MKQLLEIFKIQRHERWGALIALPYIIALNALVIHRYLHQFLPFSDNYHRLFVRTFHISGFDPLTYAVVSDWSTAYNIYRHPLLAFMMYVPFLINKGLMLLTGLNLVQFVVASLLIFCAFYAFIFLYRICRNIVGTSSADAWLLSALTFSFAFVMLSACVPDHFVMSMFMLLLTLYIAGQKIKAGKNLPPWQTIVLFFLTAGISLNNGIKVFLASLFVNRQRFWHPVHLLSAVIVPGAFIWGIARAEWHYYERPNFMARQQRNAKAKQQREDRIAKAFRDTTTLQDTALIRAGIERAIAQKAEEKRLNDSKKPWKKSIGKPIANGEFSQWTDITTPRWASIVENLLGESIQLHQDHLLRDTLTGRPVIVSYRHPLNYIVLAILVALFAIGLWCGRHSRFLWLTMSFLGFDLLIHVLLGFGLNEVYIMGAHWLFVLPIAMAYLFKAAVGHPAQWYVRLAVLGLTLFLLIWNGNLLTTYLL